MNSRPTDTDRATLRDLATRVRSVAVDVLPRHVRPWLTAHRRDPLSGLCGFASIGLVLAAAEMGYAGGVMQGRHSGETHLWARFDCGLDVDITGPQFGLPPVLVMTRTEARRLRYWHSPEDREPKRRPYDMQAYLRRHAEYRARCAHPERFPVEWWRAAVERREAA